MNQRTIRKRELMTLTAMCLLLAAVLAESNEEASEVKPFAEYDLSMTKDHPTMRLDMTYADRSIIATKDVWDPMGPTGFWIKLISPEPNSTTNECFQQLNIAAKHSIVRLSHKTILVDTLPNDVVDTRRMGKKLILLNLKNCNYTSVYDGPLSRYYKIFTSNNASDESFTLIMNGQQNCRGHDWCRLFFNPFYYKFEPLNFDCPFNRFYEFTPVGSFDGNLFVVELLDEVTNTYKIRLHNVTANSLTPYTELLRLPNFVSFRLFGWSPKQLISSPTTLSFCWRTNQDVDEDKTVHCVAFREDGTVVVNQTIVFSNVFKFYHVRSIPKGMILIGKRECNNDVKCSDVQSTTITNDNCIDSDCNSKTEGDELITVRHRYYNFKCRPSFVSQVHLRVNVSIDSVEVDHMCIYMRHTDDGSSHTYVS